MAIAPTPVTTTIRCPREKFPRLFLSVDGGVTFRCSGCEWSYTMGTQAPTGTTNASRAIGAATIPVASGGASFTIGMVILIDTAAAAEIVTATATGSGVSVPVTPFLKAHNSAVAFGQLLAAPTLSGTAMDAVPAAGGWGY